MADHDLAVIGAGPAGLAAAIAAAEAGLHVVLVDAAPRPGGQFWRHSDDSAASDDAPTGQHLWSRYTGLRRRLAALARTGSIRHIAGHSVWFVAREPDDSFTLQLTRAPGVLSAAPAVDQVTAAALVLCPGGYDRQLPVPGWDLPGVMAAGGVQALLKGSGTVAGRRAVVAGTGPFLLPVATALAEAGADVVAVCEAGSPTSWARTPWRAAAVPSKAVEAVSYAWALARHRVPYRPRTVVAAVHGTDEVEAVSLRRLDAAGRLRDDVAPVRVDVDLVAFGWGFTPMLELVTALGAATRVDTDESLVAVVDRQQRTDIAGLYAAGEATGVGGALLALAEGELAGLTAAADAGRTVAKRDVRRLQRRIARARSFAHAMHRAHPVPAGWQEWLQPDTIVCRCEEVSVAAVHAAREDLGATDARTVKLLARPGMGWCQGRVCGYATAKLASGDRLTTDDLRPMAKRSLAAPVTLGELAGRYPDPTKSDGEDTR